MEGLNLEIWDILPNLLLMIGGMALAFLVRFFLLQWGFVFFAHTIQSFQASNHEVGFHEERRNFLTKYAGWMISALILAGLSQIFLRNIFETRAMAMVGSFALNILPNIILYPLFWNFKLNKDGKIIHFEELSLSKKMKRYLIIGILDIGLSFLAVQLIYWAVQALKLLVFAFIIYKWSFKREGENEEYEAPEEEY